MRKLLKVRWKKMKAVAGTNCLEIDTETMRYSDVLLDLVMLADKFPSIRIHRKGVGTFYCPYDDVEFLQLAPGRSKPDVEDEPN